MNEPVFIVGPGRSGTSLLYRTLMKHSSFCSNELCLAETKIFNRALLGIDILKNNQSLKSYMTDDKNFELFKKDNYALLLRQFNLNKLPGFKYLCKHSNFMWTVLGNEVLLRKYFIAARKSRNCNRLVEKTPGHINSIDRILNIYPKAKILIMTRHPIEIFTSYIRRSQAEPSKKWLKIKEQNFIKHYKKCINQSIDAVEKYSDNVKIVSYEHFVNNANAEFNNICEFLNERFEASAITGGESAFDTWKPDPFLSKPISKETKKWNEYISTSEAKSIEKSLFSTMTKVGYGSIVN